MRRGEVRRRGAMIRCTNTQTARVREGWRTGVWCVQVVLARPSTARGSSARTIPHTRSFLTVLPHSEIRVRASGWVVLTVLCLKEARALKGPFLKGRWPTPGRHITDGLEGLRVVRQTRAAAGGSAYALCDRARRCLRGDESVGGCRDTGAWGTSRSLRRSCVRASRARARSRA